jgi:exodeoxyribonuclease-3
MAPTDADVWDPNIDQLTPPLVERLKGHQTDREARKGKLTPSDHAPVLIDIDAPGYAFDAGWAGAEERIAAPRGKR